MMESAKNDKTRDKKAEIKQAFEHTEATESTDHPEDQPHHFQVKLLLGDVSHTDQELAQQVADIITKELQSTLVLGHDVALLVRIDQCSEGNPRARACCGALGVGWVVLETKWSVWQGQHPLIKTQTTKLYDSACVGLADVWESHRGRKQLLQHLAPKMAATIRNAVLEKCPDEATPWSK